MSDDEDYVYSDGEEEEYNYSDGEDEVVMEKEADEPTFQVPDCSFKVVAYKEILPMMKQLAFEVSNLLGISDDLCLALLHEFRWNKERLVEKFLSEPERSLEAAGLASHPASRCDIGDNRFCRICRDECDSQTLYGLACNHKFCKDCYSGYITSSVNDGPICVTLTCPEHQCSQKVMCGTVESLCSEDVFEKFMMYMARNYIETSSTMRWCPSPGCDHVVIGSGITAVRCSCGTSFCFRCGRETHDPATCHQMELWEEKCQSESETANWILANTKKCPKCSARIEKNHGFGKTHLNQCFLSHFC